MNKTLLKKIVATGFFVSLSAMADAGVTLMLEPQHTECRVAQKERYFYDNIYLEGELVYEGGGNSEFTAKQRKLYCAQVLNQAKEQSKKIILDTAKHATDVGFMTLSANGFLLSDLADQVKDLSERVKKLESNKR